MNDEKICMNCAHWDLANAVRLTVYRQVKIVDRREYAPCKVQAVEPDAGDCMTLMGADGNCIGYEEAFSPSVDYLHDLHEAEHQNDGLDIPQLDTAEWNPRPFPHVA